MKSKFKLIGIMAIGVMLIGVEGFVAADVKAEQSSADYEGVVEDGTDAGYETVTGTTVDLVTPCRIVDTRIAGGYFSPNQRREYYVYGPNADIAPQGGNPAGCPAPRGEPYGVILNVTAIPISGQGNFSAFPANVGPPNASLVNYRSGVQNIANAASVECYHVFGPKEIEIINRYGYAYLVIDVMGYYDK